MRPVRRTAAAGRRASASSPVDGAASEPGMSSRNKASVPPDSYGRAGAARPGLLARAGQATSLGPVWPGDAVGTDTAVVRRPRWPAGLVEPAEAAAGEPAARNPQPRLTDARRRGPARLHAIRGVTRRAILACPGSPRGSDRWPVGPDRAHPRPIARPSWPVPVMHHRDAAGRRAITSPRSATARGPRSAPSPGTGDAAGQAAMACPGRPSGSPGPAVSGGPEHAAGPALPGAAPPSWSRPEHAGVAPGPGGLPGLHRSTGRPLGSSTG